MPGNKTYNPSRLSAIYNAYKADGMDKWGSEQKFINDFYAAGEQGYKNRKQLWADMRQAGADVGNSYEEFSDLMMRNDDNSYYRRPSSGGQQKAAAKPVQSQAARPQQRAQSGSTPAPRQTAPRDSSGYMLMAQGSGGAQHGGSTDALGAMGTAAKWAQQLAGDMKQQQGGSTETYSPGSGGRAVESAEPNRTAVAGARHFADKLGQDLPGTMLAAAPTYNPADILPMRQAAQQPQEQGEQWHAPQLAPERDWTKEPGLSLYNGKTIAEHGSARLEGTLDNQRRLDEYKRRLGELDDESLMAHYDRHRDNADDANQLTMDLVREELENRFGAAQATAADDYINAAVTSVMGEGRRNADLVAKGGEGDEWWRPLASTGGPGADIARTRRANEEMQPSKLAGRLQKSLADNITGILSGQLEDIKQEAEYLGKDADAYLQETVIPRIMERAINNLYGRLQAQSVPKSDAEYIANSLMRSLPGLVLHSLIRTREQRQMDNTGMALAEEGAYGYKPSTAAKVAGGVLPLAIDSSMGLFKIGAGLANVGMRGVLGMGRYTAGEAAAALVRENSKNIIKRVTAGLGRNMIRGGSSFAVYGMISDAANQWSLNGIDEWDAGQTARHGVEEFATGAALGVGGSVGNGLLGRYGINGAEQGLRMKLVHGTQGALASGGRFAIESGTFTLANLAKEPSRFFDENGRVNGDAVMTQAIDDATFLVGMKLGHFGSRLFEVKGKGGKVSDVLSEPFMARMNQALKLDPEIYREIEENRQRVSALLRPVYELRRLNPNRVSQGRLRQAQEAYTKALDGLSWDARNALNTAIGCTLARRPRSTSWDMVENEDGTVSVMEYGEGADGESVLLRTSRHRSGAKAEAWIAERTWKRDVEDVYDTLIRVNEKVNISQQLNALAGGRTLLTDFLEENIPEEDRAAYVERINEEPDGAEAQAFREWLGENNPVDAALRRVAEEFGLTVDEMDGLLKTESELGHDVLRRLGEEMQAIEDDLTSDPVVAEAEERREQAEAAYNEGYEVEEPAEMQAVNDEYAAAEREINDPELWAVISEDPERAMLTAMQSDLPQERKDAIYRAAEVCIRRRAMMERIGDQADRAAQEASDMVDRTSVDGEDGRAHVQVATLLETGEDGRPKQVFIVGGKVVMRRRGGGMEVDRDASDKSLMVKDDADGEPRQIDISEVGEVEDRDAEDVRAEAVSAAEERVIGAEGDKIDFGVNLEEGAETVFTDADGEHRLRVLKDNGDGTVQVEVDGQVMDASKEQIGMMVRPERAAAEAAPEAGAETGAENGQNGLNGQDRQDGSAGDAPRGGEAAAAGAGEAAEGGGVEDMPMKADGNPDFTQVSTERAVRYITEQLDETEAKEYIGVNVRAADAALAAHERKKPKMEANLASYKSKKAAWEADGAPLRAEAETWHAIEDTYTGRAAEEERLRAEEESRRQQEEAERKRYEEERRLAEKAAAERAAEEARNAEEERRRAAEEAAERRRRAEESRRRAAEARAKGEGAAGEQITEKWNNSERVEGVSDEIVLANGERIKGRYVLVESGAATPSHDSANEFAMSEGFPVDANGTTVNDRDYAGDREAQNITRQMAASYDSRAAQGTVPVVSRDGVVLSGNGRTMAGEIAARNGTDGAYVDYLKEFGGKFGFKASDVEKFKHPRVVFVPDEHMPYTIDTFAKFNAKEMKGQSRTEQAVKMGKMIDDSLFGRIMKLINGFESLKEFYADPKAAAEAIGELRDGGIISEMQYAEMFDGESLSPVGQDLLETALIGKAFNADPDAVRMLTEVKSLRHNVVTALRAIVDNVSMGNDFSLAEELSEAVKLAYRARMNGYKHGDAVSSYARQLTMFPIEEGETVADYKNATILMLADLVNEGRVTQLKKVLSNYNEEARDSAAGQVDMFSGGVRSKEEILSDIMNRFGYGPKGKIEKSNAKGGSAGEGGGARGQGAGGETGGIRQLAEEGGEAVEVIDPKAHAEAIGTALRPMEEHFGVKMHVVGSLDDITNSKARAAIEADMKRGTTDTKAWYAMDSGEVFIYAPHVADAAAAKKAYLHEVVAHRGLRNLLGKDAFNELCDNVWEMMDASARRRYANYRGVADAGDEMAQQRAAADEYMAHLGEDGVDNTRWERVKAAVRRAMRPLLEYWGLDASMTDADIVDLLRRSGEYLRSSSDAKLKREIDAGINGGMESEDGGTDSIRLSTSSVMEGAGFEARRDDEDGISLPIVDKSGNVLMRLGGKTFDGKHPVQASDLRGATSTLNVLMDMLHSRNMLTPEKEERIYKTYADVLNMYLRAGLSENGGADNLQEQWLWLGETVYRTVAGNSDAQYAYSLDITRVCKKNEAVIRGISALQRSLGYGITPGQIMDIYTQTDAEGYQVPCPVCYVFSRYIRNGKYASAAIYGMTKYGDHLPGGKDEWSVADWKKELGRLEDERVTFEKDVARANEDVTKLLGEIDETTGELKQVNGVTQYGEIDKVARRLLMEKDAAKRQELEARLRELDARYRAALEVVSKQSLTNWIKSFVLKGGKEIYRDARTLGERIRKGGMDEFKELSLDLRRTAEAMGKYPGIQRLRKSGGASAGKEITFESNNEFGELFAGMGNGSAQTSRNVFRELVNASGATRSNLLKSANSRLNSAVTYAQRQTLRGGQRMWSWSDNIETLMPDVMMNLLQLDMMGAALQTYSKQLEGVDLVARMGGYVNGSLMAKDNGYYEVRPDQVVRGKDGVLRLRDDITETIEDTVREGGKAVKRPRTRVLAEAGSQIYERDGKMHVLVFDDKIGIDPHGHDGKLGLFALNKELDKAGNIIVGMNDMHIRTALADPRIFFCIPWHSSGANQHILAQMLGLLGADMKHFKSTDYTKMQEEKMYDFGDKAKMVPEDVTKLWEETRKECEARDGGNYNSCFAVESGRGGLSDSQRAYRALRKKIFAGKLTAAERELVMKDEFLSQVLRKVKETVQTGTMTGKDNEFIYPYEYWDESTTYDGVGVKSPDENGRRYMEYCRRLGARPKFTGKWSAEGKRDSSEGDFSKDRGYWKLLIDRRMYGRDNKFQDLTPVDVSKFTPDLLDRSKIRERFAPTQVADDAGVQDIVSKVMETERGRTDGGIPTVDYGMSMEDAVKNYRRTIGASEEIVWKSAAEEKLKKAAVKAKKKAGEAEEEEDEDIRLMSTEEGAGEEDVRFMRGSERDADYMDAVEKGDAEKAGRMVREAARRAMPETKVVEKGEPLVMSHNTDREFNTFDRERIGTGQGQAYLGYGFNFSRGFSSTYGKNEMRVYLDARNPLQSGGHKLTRRKLEKAIRLIDQKQSSTLVGEFCGGAMPYGSREYERNIGRAIDMLREYDDLSIYASISMTSYDATPNDVIEAFKAIGFDSSIERDSEGRIINAVVFDPNQIKSAEPFTYDDNGRLIPLSERFNLEKDDIRFMSSGELDEKYPNWLKDQTEESGKHSTQIAGTLNSYKKFGEWVKKVSGGRQVSVLDASSGLGYGTEWLRENGIDADDVEPYPSSGRKAPTFSSYDDIDKKYDFIISNAVLNVIPDDWRAGLLHDMADKLNVGGKLVINVRGANSIRNQGKEGVTKITLDDPSEVLVLRPNGSVRAYQKGFTKEELKEWCEKELGDGYTVEAANQKNAGGTYDTAVVVTKTADAEGQVRFMSDEGGEAEESEVRDGDGLLGDVPGGDELASEAELEAHETRVPLDEALVNGLMQLARDNKDNVELRVRAMRSIGGSLGKLRQAMARQREYDRGTVDKIVRIAKTMLGSGIYKQLGNYQVRRLLGMVNAAAGREDITKQAQGVVDILTAAQERAYKETMAKLLKVKGSKLDQRGVEVQAGLDIAGQRRMAALKKGMAAARVSQGERTTATNEETPWGELLSDIEERLGSDDPVVSDAAGDEYVGVMLAQQWYNDIRKLEEDDRAAVKMRKEAEADVADGRMTREAYREYAKALEEERRNRRMQRLQAYEDFLGAVSGQVKAGAERAAAFREAAKERVKAIRADAGADLADVPYDEHVHQVEKRGLRHDAVRLLLKPLATFDNLLRYFGKNTAVGGRGRLFRRFMEDGFVKATDNEWRGVSEACKELDEKASEVMGKKMHWSGLFDEVRRQDKKGGGIDLEIEKTFSRQAGDTKVVHLTPGQMLYVYMVNKMADGRMKLRKMGISEQTVELIKDRLDPRFVQLADWLQDEYLVKKREKYNEVYERMFGAPMAAIENYFPLKVNQLSRHGNEDVEREQADGLMSTATGSVIKRRVNSLPLDISADAFDVVLEHIQQMEHWAAYAELNRDLNTLLSDRRFKAQVQNMKSARYGSGKDIWDEFRRTCQMVAGTYRGSAKNTADRLAVNVSKGVTGAKIAFRIFTALKQTLSYPAYFTEASASELAKSTANLKGSVKWALENLPMFARRWESRQAGDTRLQETPDDWSVWNEKFASWVMRNGMWMNAAVDMCTVAAGAKAIYETKKARYLMDGYSEAKAHEKALNDAAISYNETQQSSEAAFVSTMQVDRTLFSTMLTVFRNSPMAYTRRVANAVAELRRLSSSSYRAQLRDRMAGMMQEEGLTEAQAQRAAKREVQRAAVKNMAEISCFGLLLQAAWNMGPYMAYMLLGKDDDEKKAMVRDALLHSVAGSVEGLAFGNVWSDLFELGAVKGESAKDYEFNLLPLQSDARNAMKLWDYDMVRGVNDLVNLVVQAKVGANPQTLTDVAVALYDACKGDLGLAREAAIFGLRLINAPQSAIDKVYLDEIGMLGKDAKKLDYETLCKRYDNYRLYRQAPLTGILYGDAKGDALERSEKRFERMAAERYAMKDAEELARIFDESGDDYTLKGILGDALSDKAVKEIDPDAKGKDEFRKDASNLKEEGKAAREMYRRLRTAEDVTEDARMAYYVQQARNKGGELKKEVDAEKRAIDQLRKDIVRAPYELADGTVETRESLLAKLREHRRELIDAIRAELK